MIAIISDIHGNHVALKEVLDKIDEMRIKDIYCLGDIAGYYSQVNECCDELRKRNIPCIMGNHDWYIVGESFCPRSNAANDCLKYQRKVITDENLRWLASFPLYRQVDDICMVHGGWTDPIDEYLVATEDYFARIGGKYFVSGHTHVQTLSIFGCKMYCNPGSVGQPRDYDNRAAFALFDGSEFHLYRIEYNISKVSKLMKSAGFSEYYYNCLRTGNKHLNEE